MRTFVVLIPVYGDIDEPLEACNEIMNREFERGLYSYPTAQNALACVLGTLGLDGDFGIEVEPLDDFVERQNDGDFDSNSYYISIVKM